MWGPADVLSHYFFSIHLQKEVKLLAAERSINLLTFACLLVLAAIFIPGRSPLEGMDQPQLDVTFARPKPVFPPSVTIVARARVRTHHFFCNEIPLRFHVGLSLV